jgi:uncharacterized protein (DUF2336 family)
MLTTVAVDAMGGDHGPSVCVPSSIRFLRDHADTRLVLVGDQSTLKRLMDGHHDVAKRVEIRHATQGVAMDESARDAVRRKKDSSMRIAIELVRRGEARLGDKKVEIIPPDPIGELGSGVEKIAARQVEQITVERKPLATSH